LNITKPVAYGEVGYVGGGTVYCLEMKQGGLEMILPFLSAKISIKAVSDYLWLTIHSYIHV